MQSLSAPFSFLYKDEAGVLTIENVLNFPHVLICKRALRRPEVQKRFSTGSTAESEASSKKKSTHNAQQSRFRLQADARIPCTPTADGSSHRIRRVI